MSDYIHDEWCSINLENAKECTCYVSLLIEKDEEIEILKAKLWWIRTKPLRQTEYLSSSMDKYILAEYRSFKERMEAMQNV